MKQLNQVTGQITGEHRQQQFIANKIAKNLWYKIQRELVGIVLVLVLVLVLVQGI